MSAMVRIGLIELAFGAVGGWVVVLSVSAPAVLARVGVVKPRRILQAHLDYVIMGLILIAVGLAAPGLPGWLVVVIAVGTWINPTLFLPLAFDPRAATRPLYQAVSGVSFLAVSAGLVLAAILG